MTCPVCGVNMAEAFQATVLQKHRVRYFHCEGCGFLRTEEPYWSDQVHSRDIPCTDAGLLWRNISLSCGIASLLFAVFGERGDGIYLDRAGGYGVFVRLMRDLGFDYRWSDPYAENRFARGFEGEEVPIYRAVTAFEVVEHLHDPMGFIESSMRLATDGIFIFSTRTYEGRPPSPDAWWYYSLDTGQHVAFYQPRTIDRIAGKLNVHYYRSDYLHVFSRRKISSLWFQVAAGVLRFPLALLARKFLGSRTQADHDRLMVELSESLGARNDKTVQSK